LLDNHLRNCFIIQLDRDDCIGLAVMACE